jgi:putative ABC transport system substrate-binding protein
MRRREFITLIGCAAASIPVAARAQRSATAVVGVLSPEGPSTGNVNGLVQGLSELGYVEGATFASNTGLQRGSSTAYLRSQRIWFA